MNDRITLVIILLLTVHAWGMAAPVSKEQARQQAAEFIMQQSSLARGKQTQQNIKNRLQLVIDTPELYGFNIGTADDGYVIVSGNDLSVPILGYADRGSLDEDNMPPAMKNWLEGYRRQLKTMSENSQVPQREERLSIAPLLSSAWNQTGRYSALCPLYGGNNCVTGCLATAMAQLMNYYQWPSATADTIPGYQTASLHIQIDSLPPTAFDWTQMQNQQSQEVAKLMAYCGASVGMDYTPDGSMATNDRLPAALIRYFGYDPSMRRMMRHFFSVDMWEQTVYDELAAGRPVFYAGQTYTDEGHAFICDGYDGDGYFHINWGWGGYCDGNFLLSLCDALTGGTGGASTSAGYSIDQEMVIGIKPLKETPIEQEKRLSVRTIELRSDAVVTRQNNAQSFTGIKVYFEHFCATAEAERFELGFALVKGDEIVKLLAKTGATAFQPNQYVYSTQTLKIGGVDDGDYRIVLVSREAGSDTWLLSEGSDLRYISARIADTKLTLQQYPDMRLKVKKLDYTNGRKPNQGGEWVVTIENTGSEYNGELWIIADDAIVAGNGAYLPANDTTEVKFLMMPFDQVRIATDKAGTNIIYSGPDVMSTLSAISLNTPELTNGSSVKAGSVLSTKVNVCRGIDNMKSYQLAYQIDQQPLVPISNVPSLKTWAAATCYLSLTIPDTLSSGIHTLSFYATHVNDEALSEEDMQATKQHLSFTVYREGLGRQKVFVGHYTYTGAGYGSVVDQALAQLKNLRGDDYTIVSTHVSDELWCMDQYASIFYSYLVGSSMPVITFDRYAEPGQTDALYTKNKYVSSGEEISEVIDEMLKLPSFATLDLTAEMSSDNQIALTVSGKAAAELQTIVGDVNLTVMLAEDSVKMPQYDGFGGFIENYQHMNVLRRVLTPVWGEPVAWTNRQFTTTFTIDMSDGYNYCNMKAVAILGKPFTNTNYSQLHLTNCNDLSFAGIVPEVSGIRLVQASQPVTTQRYSLDGRQLSVPQRGMNIIRQSDGTVRKVIVK